MYTRETFSQFDATHLQMFNCETLGVVAQKCISPIEVAKKEVG
jgi:hypothetical protein